MLILSVHEIANFTFFLEVLVSDQKVMFILHLGACISKKRVNSRVTFITYIGCVYGYLLQLESKLSKSIILISILDIFSLILSYLDFTISN